MENTRKHRVMWMDLTVPDAASVSDFYAQVVGWQKEGHDMGGYEDYVMKDGEEGVAGVCYARGANAHIPPQWMLYVTVDDLDKSLEECERLGGKVVGDKRSYGKGSYCMIQDPAGAYMALCQE